jgi:thioredoxin 1
MITIFNKESLDNEIKKNSIIVLDFYAVWCSPCVAFSPKFEEVAKQYSDKAVFGKINIDECRDLAVKYRISSIPTIIIIKDGAIVWQHIGSIDKKILSEKIEVLI